MSCWTCSQQGCFCIFADQRANSQWRLPRKKTDIFNCRVGSTDGSFARKPSLKRLASAVRRTSSRTFASYSHWCWSIKSMNPSNSFKNITSSCEHVSLFGVKAQLSVTGLLSAFWASPHADQQWIRLDLNKRRIPASWTVSRLPCSSCSTTAKLSSSLATSETAEMRTNSLSTSARSAVATNSSSVT